MSHSDADRAYRAALRALPDPRFDGHQFVHLMRTLPPPPPGATVAWRHAHLREIIQEIRALNPANLAEASSVVLIIATRHAAADSVRRSLDPTLSVRLAERLHRCAESLLRAAGASERQLRKRQAGRAGLGQGAAEIAFDVEALDAVWCGITGLAPVPEGDPAGAPTGGPVGDGGPVAAAPRAAWQ